MTVKEMIARLDELTPDEMAELQSEIERRKHATPAHVISPAERVRRMRAAAQAIREGFSDDEWAKVEKAINEEYLEPLDDDIWRD
jgi:uncharacterized alpha-E superfamily protein